MNSEILIDGSWIKCAIDRKPRPPIVTPLPMGDKRVQPNRTDIEVRLSEVINIAPGVYQARQAGISFECHIIFQQENVLLGVIHPT